MDHVDRLDIRDIAIGRRSSLPAPWEIVEIVDLTREDLILVAAPSAPDPRAPLARISAPHHTLAQLIAKGKSDIEVSAITGYTVARVRTLQNDPAFSELVAHYESMEVIAKADIQVQITHIALAAGSIIQERLDDDPGSFTKKELREFWTAGLDRVGHGPRSITQVNINDPHAVIENLGKILETENRGRVLRRDSIPAEYTEVTNVTPAPSSGTETCDPGIEGPVSVEAEIKGPSGAGDFVSEQGSGPT